MSWERSRLTQDPLVGRSRPLVGSLQAHRRGEGVVVAGLRPPEQAFGQLEYLTPPEAVFEEDVVAHYQDFLDRRRAQRPVGEYRQPTVEDWADFKDHFDERPESSSAPAAGPTARPARINHLRPLPHAVDQPEDAAPPRRTGRGSPHPAKRATEEGWRGEVEGLELTLKFLRSKRVQAQRAASIGTVSVGMPAPARPPRQRPEVTHGGQQPGTGPRSARPTADRPPSG
jgi:hypothetical protein